jgi:hypothetical protein
MDIADTIAQKAYRKVVVYCFSGTGNSGRLPVGWRRLLQITTSDVKL